MTDDMEAAEYVLGTLDAAERADVATRLGTSADLRNAVAAWEARFLPLSAMMPGAPLPEDLWARILRALPPPAPTALKVVQGGASVGLRKAVRRWRTTAFAMGAIAAALALFVIQRDVLAPPPAPTFVAAVNRGGDMPALLVRVDLAKGDVTVRQISSQTEPGHSLELWYIGADAPPKSMGLVEGASLRMPMPPGLSPETGTFAVTMEPIGGSRNGKPSGPPIYSGKLIRE